jgi:hypothetical protein
MDTRVSWALSTTDFSTDASKRALRGSYRLFAAIRRVGASQMVLQARWRYLTGATIYYGATTTVPVVAGRQLLDLGTITFGFVAPANPGGFGTEAPVLADIIDIQASRVSGTESLDWDTIFLIPADEQMLLWSSPQVGAALIDGATESIYRYESAGDPFAGTADLQDQAVSVAGGYPHLVPNQANRFFMLCSTSGVHDKTLSQSITCHYWPRYLYCRPT